MRRDLTLYWWGQTTSAFGSFFTAVAFPLIAVVQLDATAAEAGLLSAAGMLPVLLLGLPLGALADRVTRPRRVLVALDTASALAVGTVALGLAAGSVTLVWLACLSAVRAALGSMAGSLYFVHLRELVSAEGVGPARARLQAGQFGASLVGRSLAGPAVALFGGAAALAVDAASYLLSATALLAMRSPDRSSAKRRTPGDRSRGATAGLRFFVGHTYHRALLTFLLSSAVCLSGVTALTGIFLLRGVGLPESAYGLVFALSGVTGMAGSFVAGRMLRPGSDARRVTALSFALAACSALLLPMAVGPLPLAASVAALGISLPVFFGAIANVGLGSVLTADVPEAELGRAMAAVQVLVAAANVLGALGGGLLGQWIGVHPALWALNLARLGVVAVAVPPAVRAARRLRSARPPEAESPAEAASTG
ncbi:MFS transporter [Streptomyces sp. NPDC090029]|uniref:MFS transporter n=1 Tax=Streptomyces sp. NPDC090029 TaxID=3365924 RepID=UPI0038130DA1